MGDKIRGGLFNVLGDVEGLRFLDAFAGSGAIGFEALSRGAASVTGIERDRQAQKIIVENIEALGLAGAYKLVTAPVFTWAQAQKPSAFDVIVADPPYDDTQIGAINALVPLLSDSGVLVVSWPKGASLPDLQLKLVVAKQYGDAQLGFYRAVLD